MAAKKSAKKSTGSAPKPKAATPKVAADEVDEQLARYRSMRDFGITAEPPGGPEPTPLKKPRVTQGLPFVIQKHAASHLHYDFRLGWNGVLKSWACAKGPSYSTRDRRLAVQVEDHPMEYGGFEGIIPKGQYGGGTVMVWDQGTWWPQPGHENVDAGLRDGSLKFEMSGTKMQGKWTLIRMNGKAAKESKPNWLLIKEHDEYEKPADAQPITESAPNLRRHQAAASIKSPNRKTTSGNPTKPPTSATQVPIKVPKGQAWHRASAKPPAAKLHRSAKKSSNPQLKPTQGPCQTRPNLPSPPVSSKPSPPRVNPPSSTSTGPKPPSPLPPPAGSTSSSSTATASRPANPAAARCSQRAPHPLRPRLDPPHPQTIAAAVAALPAGKASPSTAK